MRISIVLSAIFLLGQCSYAQATPAGHVESEPKLPVVDENACPFEGCTFGPWKVTKDSTLYSAWESNRKIIATLKQGQNVTAITGVHITIKPDVIRITKAVPTLSLRAGDRVLRYMYHGEGFADIWANGKWTKEADCSFVTEKNGDGCGRDCAGIVEQEGIKEWWVKVRIESGLIGWVKVDNNFEGMDSLGRLLPPRFRTLPATKSQ